MSEDDALVEHRFAASSPWATRLERLRSVVVEFDPEWVSLQFVCYGFQSRGFVRGLAERLKPILEGRHIHIMLHELWIGGHVGASLKERLMGLLQRRYVLELLRKLSPDVIHTSNPTYAAILQLADVPATVLPLFGSIPVVRTFDRASAFELLNQAGAGINEADRGDIWMIGFFGSLPTIWPSEPLVSMLAQAASEMKKRIVFISIGQLGAGEPLWRSLSAKYPSITFVQLGQRPTPVVSALLQTVDLAISPTPWNLTGKSSSVAALLEHGTPVLVNRPPIDYRIGSIQPSTNDLLMPFDEHLADKLVRVRRQPPRSRLPEITTDFLNALDEVRLAEAVS